MVENGTKVIMEGVKLIFRNFSGEKSRFNQDGKRNFGVLLDQATADALLADGWNVKTLEPREEDEGDEAQPWLPVEIRFDVRPPQVYMITERGRTKRKEEDIGEFDDADIINVDMVVRAHVWEVNEKTGVKAYVSSLYVTIEEDELAKKYAEMDTAS